MKRFFEISSAMMYREGGVRRKQKNFWIDQKFFDYIRILDLRIEIVFLMKIFQHLRAMNFRGSPLLRQL